MNVTQAWLRGITSSNDPSKGLQQYQVIFKRPGDYHFQWAHSTSTFGYEYPNFSKANLKQI